MEAMVGDKVPEDIIYEILLKLPVRSLLRFTAVCKSWNCMIKSSTFITHHLIQKEDVQLLLHNPQYGMYLLYKDDDNDDGRSSSTLREYTNLDNPYDFYDRGLASHFVGTCKGLVCLAVEDIDSIALVWNPSIRKFVVLPKSGVTFYHEYCLHHNEPSRPSIKATSTKAATPSPMPKEDTLPRCQTPAEALSC
ncbi:hypothetical protein L3X38_040814 [Prunus dulcis]|uniref:F-box domain-containing protein n=1 Tax=Prunus dulcis TaxID=3755 RepID=A0AAD4UTK2_PRUDU|nr:hypothetical protein L3X38_040814 [Prunus dulcis]